MIRTPASISTARFDATDPYFGHLILDALLAPEGRGPLWRPLPGSPSSIYDHLADCL